MNAVQKVKQLILSRQAVWQEWPVPALTAGNIDAAYQEAYENDDDSLQDEKSEVRQGTCETGLDAPSSRHYKSKEVAAQAVDGSWVGWTYWYGGGKHGEPESIDWIEYAYDLTCTEEVVTITKQTFAKVSE